MIKYINSKNLKETIDQVDSADFKTMKDFYKYVRYLVDGYRLAYRGMNIDVYASQRAYK